MDSPRCQEYEYAIKSGGWTGLQALNCRTPPVQALKLYPFWGHPQTLRITKYIVSVRYLLEFEAEADQSPGSHCSPERCTGAIPSASAMQHALMRQGPGSGGAVALSCTSVLQAVCLLP